MTTDMTNYKTSELAQSVDVDDYAVRDEAERRQTRAIQAAWTHIRQEQPATIW